MRAEFHLGFLYSTFPTFLPDYTKGETETYQINRSLYWYNKAAADGDKDAMFALGVDYEKGDDVWPQPPNGDDYTQAMSWFNKAANLGNADAMVSIGQMYENGNGVSQDYIQALSWYQKALANDDGNSFTQNAAQNGIDRVNAAAQAQAAQNQDNENLAAPADTTGRVVLDWTRNDRTDALSGAVTLEAQTDPQPDATGEMIQATATCDNSSTELEEDIEFAFVGNKPVNLLWNGNSISIEYRYGIQAAQTVTANQGNYSNAVTISFPYSVMTVARNVGVELPLANGNTVVVEINPKDPTLRAFADVCEKQYEAANPPSNTTPQ